MRRGGMGLGLNGGGRGRQDGERRGEEGELLTLWGNGRVGDTSKTK